MMKTFLEAVKFCLPKEQDDGEGVECNIEELGSENNHLPCEENISSTNETKVKKESISKAISFRVKCNDTFGLEEDDGSTRTPVQSPKFGESPSLIHCNSNNSMNNSNQAHFDFTTPPQSETEEGNQFFFKEKLSDIKERKKTLLFTVNDPEKEEMSERVFCMNNIVILDSEIDQAKKLTVEDEEGDLLSGYLLLIDASGYVNSSRKRRDGHVFFGPVIEYKNCIINDFKINSGKEICKKRLFVIFYERNEQKYYIRHIQERDKSTFLYVRIQKPFKIKRKLCFSLNQIIISVNPNFAKTKGSQQESSSSASFESNEIKVVVYNSDPGQEKIKKVYYFKPSDSPVLIGRSKCSITINSSSLSKKHCALIFSHEDKSWEIIDGYANRPSLNGTWMMLNSKFEINEKTYFKIGKNIVKINII